MDQRVAEGPPSPTMFFRNPTARKSFQPRIHHRHRAFQCVTSRSEYFPEVHRVRGDQATSPEKIHCPTRRKTASLWAQSDSRRSFEVGFPSPPGHWIPSIIPVTLALPRCPRSLKPPISPANHLKTPANHWPCHWPPNIDPPRVWTLLSSKFAQALWKYFHQSIASAADLSCEPVQELPLVLCQ